uniref:Uncharacterized protein n=1 Tax=Anopheles farauti TaxID=69004 RepID=A0A182QJH3_9DIPT
MQSDTARASAQPAMDQYFEEMIARIVLAYLIDEDMYVLAEQLCQESPYLKPEHQTMLNGEIPVNYLRLSLREIVRDFTKMQGQLLRLVNLCSAAVPLPNDKSVVVQMDHLLGLLKEGTGQMLDQIIALLAPAVAETLPNSTDLSPSSKLFTVVAPGFFIQPTEDFPPPTDDHKPSTVPQPAPPPIIPSTTYPTNQPPPPPPPDPDPDPDPPAKPTETKIKLSDSAVRPGATPLDHPILPRTGNSQSTSSQKRSHIRILDFSTPMIKRGSPSTTTATTTVATTTTTTTTTTIQPQKELLSTTTQTDEPAMTNQRERTDDAREPKPKKRIPKRKHPYGRYRRRYAARRSASGQTTLPVPNAACRRSTRRPTSRTSTARNATASNALDLSNKSADMSVDSQTNQQLTSPPRQLSTVTATNITSTSTNGMSAGLTGSPGCPVDPLAVFPMTPRFLNRPLQVLGTLSPLLGALDSNSASKTAGVSASSVPNSHTKQLLDINTPGYPITPGCTITPSPPPEGATYYQPPEPAPHDEHSNSPTIYIRYRERLPGHESPTKPPAVDHALNLAEARFEIVYDDGQVCQITTSPLFELYNTPPATRPG